MNAANPNSGTRVHTDREICPQITQMDPEAGVKTHVDEDNTGIRGEAADASAVSSYNPGREGPSVSAM